jgi:two-component system, cell cycle sensor histidine kinase and response regulator CckA
VTRQITHSSQPRDGSARVLVVDDEEVIQLLLRQVLEQDGLTVDVATTAGEALDYAGRALFDVVLVDKNLPDRSGFDVMREFKERQPECELIMITGYASLDSAIEAIQAGAFDYVLKPFEDINDLRVKVRNAADKRQLRRALSEVEERYQRLFAATTDAIVVYDSRTGLVQEANVAAQRLYGYSEQEFKSLHARDLAAPLADPGSESQVGSGARTTPRGLIARRDLRKDKTAIDVEVTTASFVLGDDKLIAEVTRDITQRVRAEREREVLRDQLRQSQKMEAIGRLAGGVAHDFNNLLTVINNYVDFVRAKLATLQTPQSEELVDYLDRVAEAGRSATALTQQLLATSRRHVGALEILNINGCVERVDRLLQRTIGAHIDLKTKGQADLWSVRMDRGHVEQLLMNLAVNAGDAMPDGGTLTIETANADLPADEAAALNLPAGRYVRIRLLDTGAGIPPEDLDRIFEPFFTTKPDGKGTGLGLATVFGIVEQARGKIHVHSEQNRGTRFTIHLPATDEESESSARIQSRVELRGRGETILLVEDDEAVREVVRGMLDRAGYSVIEARRAEEGMLAFQRHQSDIALVLADVMLPQMNGVELIRRLAENHPGLRALYMSGYASEELLGHSIDLAKNFIAKPFTAERLLTTVRGALDSRSHRPS